MNPFLIALQPLRHYADFKGRSTRTELLMFGTLSSAIGAAIGIAMRIAGVDILVAQAVVSAALLCPSLAVGVRRLHDVGRRGWWLLLALPSTLVKLADQYLFWRNSVTFPPPHMPWFVELPADIPLLVVMVLLLWKDDERPNIYGPNPRCPDWRPPDDAGEPA